MMNSCVSRLLLFWMPNIAESICRKVGENLRRPTLHAIILTCGTKTARIAPPNTLNDLYTRLLPKAQPYLNSDTQIQTLYWYNPQVNPVLSHWCVAYAVLLFCRSTACFITLLSFTQHFHIAELYPILAPRWGILMFNILLSSTRS